MSEVWRSLVQGGSWSARERAVGRWLRRLLLLGLVAAGLKWNAHMQRVGAEHQVWMEWVNEQCRTGDRERCLSYLDVALKSGLAGGRFWDENPRLVAVARCVERKGWLHVVPIRLDYSEFAQQCRRDQVADINEATGASR
ncbi:hypothetical protein H8Z72_23490 (plasmid) [Xanthomonas citri pv. citri]|uniref:hypothetical protein n=1 Tax=Xanthomonas citri TaxID=346 RepID=UPI001933B130|nr:hypothetical protein [Xanthomonas citri]QRD62721.1 hypothetical protein H8Z74_22695 [Xanthomonas citri pv. citri]QRD67048.1 hypothetical protein H8Z73_22780 [Xanthomonas citri pv. citri]QRD71699.1 hypothetical protein H8Z72_23490 [Xanthomonas citri pv. citri]